MTQLVSSTLSCYQDLKRVQLPASSASVATVINATTQAASGDLSLLDAIQWSSDRNLPQQTQSAPISHDQYAAAMRAATAAHDVPALRVLYAVCHAANASSMQLLHSATDQEVMTAAHHVVECYHPWPDAASAPDRGQCIASPAE